MGLRRLLRGATDLCVDIESREIDVRLMNVLTAHSSIGSECEVPKLTVAQKNKAIFISTMTIILRHKIHLVNKRATFLVISHVTHTYHRDIHRFEKISNIQKQFKVIYSETQVQF
ncbi:ras-related gtp-binding protein a [Plasmopara halstedii]|uniref:Ras-related gtp-binding protein a n=1 Tax=Plasmopara halstedii TaxID=4781 RepID=A0A0P1AXB3_PLAHL|nr:ras-related gtp-binding protein a [Plasmopara halstedii]CEG45382.1 ras-related gtp-binding protein a [Plasmopara halstedii]|eukprot:XP_024581751.1 ras-related gtp-binding protein a [Plasmopara halstedii]